MGEKASGIDRRCFMKAGAYATAAVGTARQGVHEHWNNGHDKLYSRNLGADEGIELLRVDL